MNSDPSPEPNARIEQLIAQLSAADDVARESAATTLGQAKERRAVPALLKLLDESDSRTRAMAAAVRALGEIGDQAAIAPLIAAARRPLLCGLAVEALAKFRNDRALEAIIDIFRETKHSDFATLLGNWGDARATDALI